MVGIFGSGSYFICRWKRACSGEGAWVEGDNLICALLCCRAIPDVYWPTLQPKPKVFQRGCLDEVCWAATFWGQACRSESQPKPSSLWSLHLFLFPSEAAAPWAAAPWSGDRPYHRLGAYPLFPNAPAMLLCPYTWHGRAGVMVRGSWATLLGSATGQRVELGHMLRLFLH